MEKSNNLWGQVLKLSINAKVCHAIRHYGGGGGGSHNHSIFASYLATPVMLIRSVTVWCCLVLVLSLSKVLNHSYPVSLFGSVSLSLLVVLEFNVSLLKAPK